LEAKTAKAKVIFPYIPTLLSFRDAPPIFKVFRQLEVKPDVLIVNGHGVSHPYGCGLASYVGIILKQPTIGVASRLLCGEVGPKIGDIAPIIYEGQTVGAALFTEARRPIYISVGNMVSLERAAALTRSLLRGSRMPEPLKVADALAKRTVRRLEV
jgi:deoxyribonuclease V